MPEVGKQEDENMEKGELLSESRGRTGLAKRDGFIWMGKAQITQ